MSDMPYGICDVTVPIRFCLDANGLKLESMSTKENLLGFYNPIPKFRPEHEYPVLCIIYKEGLEGPIHINYYSDK